MKLLKKPIFIILWLYSLPLIISLCYGFQYRFVETGLDSYFRAWTLPWIVGLVVLVVYAFRESIEFSSDPPAWLGLLLSSLSLALTCFFYAAKVMPTPAWLAFAVLPALVAMWLGRRSPGLSIRFLALVGLIVNLYLIAVIPHTSGANMLEIIDAAAADFLAGNNPYHTFEDIAGDHPFGYLPGMWLPYVPLVWLDIDSRLLNVLLLLLIVWLFETHFAPDKQRRALILGATLYPLLLSPPVSQMIVHGHIWPYWAVVISTVVLLGRERYVAAAIFFGLVLATRQPALWLVFPLVGYLASHVGWLNTVRYGSLSLVVYLLVMLPFTLLTGGAIWKFAYLGISGATTSQPHLSAATWLSSIGLTDLLLPIQVLVLLFAMYWLYRRKTDFATFLAVTGVAYLLVVFFNNYAVRYVYIPGLLLYVAGIVVRLAPSREIH